MSLTADRTTLLAIRATLDPSALLNWRPNLGISDWDGVGIENERVAFIYLGNMRLAGTIPPELGALDAAAVLTPEQQRN